MTLKLLKCLFTEPFLVISGLSGPQIWLGNDNSLHFFFSGGDYDCKIEEVDIAKFDLIARWWYIICAMFVCLMCMRRRLHWSHWFWVYRSITLRYPTLLVPAYIQMAPNISMTSFLCKLIILGILLHWLTSRILGTNLVVLSPLLVK